MNPLKHFSLHTITVKMYNLKVERTAVSTVVDRIILLSNSESIGHKYQSKQ